MSAPPPARTAPQPSRRLPSPSTSAEFRFVTPIIALIDDGEKGKSHTERRHSLRAPLLSGAGSSGNPVVGWVERQRDPTNSGAAQDVGSRFARPSLRLMTEISRIPSSPWRAIVFDY